ncbi:cytidine deaminase-like protein [Mycena sp. CBHHK59/15]|nr:cytidine deaminase-like protein [Mycena sp. CBHHK59/15]
MLSTQIKHDLIEAAFQAKASAYSPYSNPVGASLLTRDCTIIGGSSIDNISYGGNYLCRKNGDCQSSQRRLQGVRGVRRRRVDVAGTISPCGLCRQVIGEFCEPEMPVLLIPGGYPTGELKETTVGELLPDDDYRYKIRYSVISSQ